MSNRTVTTNQLTPGTLIAVRGKLSYSRLTSRIEGEELRKDMARRQQKGWIPIDKPYTTATIEQAEVICKNPQNRTPEEVYALESLYTSTTKQQAGYQFTANNKGTLNLPYIAQRDMSKPSVVKQVLPEGELASGLDVTLILRVFKGKPNNGVTLDGVIVNEPIRYFDSARAGAGLDQLGISFEALPAGAIPTSTPSAEPAAPVMAPSAPATDYAAHTDAPFSSQPAQPVSQPAYNQNAYGASPAPAQTAPDMGAAAAAAAGMNPPVNPFGNPDNGNGIRYNPNDPNGPNSRNY